MRWMTNLKLIDGCWVYNFHFCMLVFRPANNIHDRFQIHAGMCLVWLHLYQIVMVLESDTSWSNDAVQIPQLSMAVCSNQHILECAWEEIFWQFQWKEISGIKKKAWKRLSTMTMSHTHIFSFGTIGSMVRVFRSTRLIWTSHGGKSKIFLSGSRLICWLCCCKNSS